MSPFILPVFSDKSSSVVAKLGILVGFISFGFYLFYWVKRLKVPPAEEYKRSPHPWENVDDN